jgi:hypothetical protein
MRHFNTIVIAAVVIFACRSGAAGGLRPGDSFTLGGKAFVVQRFDAVPYVENDYSKRFRFESFDNPKLRSLREKYRLDEVVAPGKDEFERQLLLLDWVNHRFKKFGKPSSEARGALDILEANDAGHAFFCAHYADVFVSAAASLGWVDRALALRRPDHVGQGSTEHSSTEIWSNQYRKWVMLDPTFAMYVEKDGVPLNAFEIRREWFERDGRDLVFVLDKERRRYRKADMPVLRGRYKGFGDLVLDPGALNPYGFIGYIPNTDFLDAGKDYGRMFITQDALCGATKWHKRDVPKNPAVDPYFPINQAAVTLEPRDSTLRIGLRTLTPNFKTFLARIDGAEWRPVGESFDWELRDGANRLEVMSVNRFDVEGANSMVEIKPAS